MCTIRANADTGTGGSVYVGGELQGGGDLPTAQTVTVDRASWLEASAEQDGDGGTVVVWADDETQYQGTAAARGGSDGGDGGFVEVSGKQTLDYAGTVDVGAPRGDPGTLLLDPHDITIILGSATGELSDTTPVAGDMFGSSFSVLSNGNILVTSQNADVGGLTDAGEIFLFDSTGTLLSNLQGGSTLERLGATVQQFSVPTGTFLVKAPAADIGGLVDAGTAILVDNTTGAVLGRLDGQFAGDEIGTGTPTFRSNGNFLHFRSTADPAGVLDAGSVLLADNNGNFLGRIDGNSPSEFLGNTIQFFGFNDFIIRSSGYQVGANVNAGVVILATDTDLGGGNIERGRVSGSSPNESLGNLGITTRTSGNYVIRSANADIGGNMDAGSVILASGTTGNLIGRVDGNSANERLGDVVDFFTLPGGSNFLIRSRLHDVGANADSGAVIMATDTDLGGGNIERGRVSGSSASENLGLFTVITRGSGNYVIRSTAADPGGVTDAGSVILASGMTGNEIGRFDGDTMNEFFGATFNTGTLGSNDFLVFDPQHGGGAGIVAQLADVDLGSGVIRRGGVDGATTGDAVGNLTSILNLGGRYIVRATSTDIGPNMDAGSVILVDTATGNVLGRVDGGSASEFLGSNSIITRGSGNYIIRSTSADIGGNMDAGSVLLASGTTGNLLGRFDGDTASEFFGASFNTFTLGSNDFLVFDAQHGGGAGIVAQLADVDLGGGVIRRGGVDGATTGDAVGNLTSILNLGGRYIVRATSTDIGPNMDAGSVILVDTATGNVLGRVDGGSASEFLGSNSIITRGSGNYIIRSTSADIGGNMDAGSVLLASGTTGNLLGRFDGDTASEFFGASFNIFTLGSNDFLVFDAQHGGGAGIVAQLADVDLGGGVIRRGGVDGATTGDAVGNLTSILNLGGRYIVRATSTDIGPNMDAGSVILVDTATGNVLGRVDGGSPNEGLGAVGITTRGSGNYVIRAAFADIGGNMDAGSVLLASGTTGNLLGRFDGDTANEFFGNSVNFGLGFNDFLVFDADHGGGAGIVAQLADVDLGGGVIRRGGVDGVTTGDAVGNIASPTILGTKYIVRASLTDIGGNMDAGSVILIDTPTGNVLGRVDGGSAGELLGDFSAAPITTRSNGNYFINSTLADPGGVMDAGSLILVDGMLGTEIGRLDGNTTRVGSVGGLGTINFCCTLFPNVLVQAPTHNNGAVLGAGGVFVVADTDLGGGNIVRGSVLGASDSEGLGSTIRFSVGPGSNYLIRSINADVGGNVDAGAIILVDRNTGNELGRVSGTSANEQLGSSSIITSGSNFFQPSPNADIGGLVDAGSMLLVDGTTGTLIGRADGLSAGENFGAISPLTLSGNILVRSPTADVNGLLDAGSLVQIDTTTGLAVQRVSGISANEMLGSLSFPRVTLSDGRILFGSPMADVGGQVDAGRLVFFDPTATAVGSQFSFANLPGDDFTVTNQTIQNILATGGSLILQANNDIIIDPATVIFSENGSLTLQAGRSITINGTITVPNLTLIANEMNGPLPAFRDAGTGDVTIFGTEVVTGNGVINGETITIQSGSPSFVLSSGNLEVNATTKVQLLGGVGEGSIAALIALEGLTINAPLLELFSGAAPDVTLGGQLSSEIFGEVTPDIVLPAVAFTFAGAESNINVDNIFLQGGSTPDSFAALVSLGQFNVEAGNIDLVPGTEPNTDAVFLALGGAADIRFTNCTGCEDLFSDPLIDPLPESGIFIAGLFRDPAVEAILALVSEEAEASEEAAEDGAGEGGDDDDEGESDESTSAECN